MRGGRSGWVEGRREGGRWRGSNEVALNEGEQSAGFGGAAITATVTGTTTTAAAAGRALR